MARGDILTETKLLVVYNFVDNTDLKKAAEILRSLREDDLVAFDEYIRLMELSFERTQANLRQQSDNPHAADFCYAWERVLLQYRLLFDALSSEDIE